MGKKRIIVFGMGKFYERRKDLLGKQNIVAFTDNDVSMQGNKKDQIPIIAPEEIIKYEYDYICLASGYQDEMLKQLLNLGIHRNKILKYNELGRLDKINKLDRYKILYSNKKRAVFLSHLCNRTGGPIALLNMAKVMAELDIDCTMITISMEDSKEEYEKYGIRVIEEDDISINNIYLMKFLRNQNIIVINGIIMRDIVEPIQDLNIPILWWIHESLGAPLCNFDCYNFCHKNNLHVYGVGPLACEMFKIKMHDNNIDTLLYGVDELEFKYENNRNDTQKDKVVFAIIGRIMYDKGHDILINAINALSRNIREKCVFKVIGAPSDRTFCQKWEKTINSIDEIDLCGEYDRNQLVQAYKEIDVVICPSRNDTMPTVMAEAMLNKKVCITSDKTGIAKLIKNGENGFVFEELSSLKLAEIIEHIINNRAELAAIGMKGYHTFEQNFSMPVFKGNIIKIMKSIKVL